MIKRFVLSAAETAVVVAGSLVVSHYTSKLFDKIRQEVI